MEHLPEFNSDRRDYFRINDMVFIDVTPLEQDEDLRQVVNSIKNPQPTDILSQEKQQLETIQASLSHLVDQINHNDREVARALRLLDDKISIIYHAVQRQQNSSETRKMTDANLSAGGIAFLTSNEFASKDALELDIQLQPSGTIIHTIANVIACERPYDAPKDTPYHLRLAFTHMSEYDRNFLVKHTLSRQAEILRSTPRD